MTDVKSKRHLRINFKLRMIVSLNWYSKTQFFFYKKLYKLHKSINFTFELGGKELPFLNIKIKLKREEIITKVHKK